MKTIITTIGLSFLFSMTIFAQVEPRLYQTIQSIDFEGQGDFSPWIITHHNYLPSGVLDFEIMDGYDLEGNFTGTFGTFYSYDENEKLLLRQTTRRYNSTVKIWITEFWLDYTYDNNGCETSFEYVQNVGGTFYKIDYEKNADCQPTKSTFWFNSPQSNTLEKWSENEYTYMQDGISYESKRYIYDLDTGEKELEGHRHFFYNTDGLIEESRSRSGLNRVDNWTGSKAIYTYDQHGNVVTVQRYNNSFSIPQWYLVREERYFNEYDEQNRLVKITKEEYELNSGILVLDESDTFFRTTDYACGDLVERTETGTNSNNLGFQYEYFHEGKDECFEIENVMLEMSVFPNPSSGEITIDSPILESGNTQIKVFSIDGKAMLEKTEIKRATTTTMNLSHFPNGIYVIQLMNQDHFAQEKVVMVK